MDLKALVGSVTIATTGLTTCNNTGGAVDPPPPPLVCTDSGPGPIAAMGTVAGSTLTVVASSNSYMSRWKAQPAVSGVTGGTLGKVTWDPSTNLSSLTIVISLSGTGPTSGSLTIDGTLFDGVTDCPVHQTLQFSVAAGGNVTVSLLEDALPLRSLVPASILVLNREGPAVDLAPMGASAGARVTWSATAGRLVVHQDGRATWSLPSEPGLYQIELLVERGEDGLAIDTLAMEVAAG
jgi:hypothetical protein